MNLDDLTARAFSAYFRTAAADGAPDQPSAAESGIETHDGLTYVVLRNVRGVLACYRVRNDGKLKRLVRVPAALRGA